MNITRWLHASLMCCVFFGAMAGAEDRIQPRIIGGQAAGIGEHEFFVVLLNKYTWGSGVADYHWNPFCGGSYLGNGLVVTAAHCVDNYTDNATLHLLVGNYSDDMEYEFCRNKDTGPYDCISSPNLIPIANYHYTGWVVYTGAEAQIINVPSSQITVHPYYRDYRHDVALIELTVTPSNPSLSLPATDFFTTLAEAGAANSVMVIGHGDTLSDADSSTFEASPQLMEVALTPRTDALCSDKFGAFDPYSMLCAGDPGEDSCQGDSGGPLFDPTTGTLLGIVSWGPYQCGHPIESYGVYTDVVHYKEWIQSRGTRGLNVLLEYSYQRDGITYRMGNEGAGSLGVPIMALSLLLFCLRRRR